MIQHISEDEADSLSFHIVSHCIPLRKANSLGINVNEPGPKQILSFELLQNAETEYAGPAAEIDEVEGASRGPACTDVFDDDGDHVFGLEAGNEERPGYVDGESAEVP
jgi:hypothetical protein